MEVLGFEKGLIKIQETGKDRDLNLVSVPNGRYVSDTRW